jgi:hypothetical protein
MLAYGVRSGTQSHFGGVVLVSGGVAFIALAATAMLTDHEALAGTFGVLGLLGFTLAALAPRMQGQVTASLTGFRFELVRQVVDAGERTGTSDDVILEAVRKALLAQADKPADGDLPDQDDGPDVIFRGPRTVRSADDLLAEARQALDRR